MSIKTLDRPGRDAVSGLIIGYEADARSGIDLQDQISRLVSWRRSGWSAVWYHYHILALLIGYAQAKRKGYNSELPGMEAI
jgi:hypothetical protein